MAQNPNAIFLNVPLETDRVAAERGNSTANIRLGYRYLTGTAGIIDPVKAAQCFSKAAVSSRAGAAWLGYITTVSTVLFGSGIDGPKLVRDAANENDVVGMALLGRLYHHGKGVLQDRRVAAELYRAAGPKFALAQTFLGELLMESASPGDHAKALTYFLSATSVGETRSMYRLATMYLRGEGVSKSPVRAAEWLTMASGRGDPAAIYHRGLLYQKGLGVNKSRGIAASLFRRAAVAGYAPAQAALGVCYEKGFGVSRDLALAKQWLSLAAPKNEFAARRLAVLR